MWVAQVSAASQFLGRLCCMCFFAVLSRAPWDWSEEEVVVVVIAQFFEPAKCLSRGTAVGTMAGYVRFRLATILASFLLCLPAFSQCGN